MSRDKALDVTPQGQLGAIQVPAPGPEAQGSLVGGGFLGAHAHLNSMGGQTQRF